jgi:hypothetical protein
MSSYNNRGQLLDFVKKSVDDNMKYEKIFIDYIKTKYDINIIKKTNPYKHYDFSFNKVHKIEYKGLYYSFNQNDTATKINKSSTIINNVMISCHKIAYYKIRQLKNPSLKFYLIYGFYESNEENEIIKIVYKYIDISNLDIFNSYKTMIFMNANHYLIPIKDLQHFNNDKMPFI